MNYKLFTLMLSLSLIGLSHTTTTAYALTKKVGVIAPLSGSVAIIGETVKNCVILMDEEKDTSHKVDFIIEDDGFNTRNTVAALHKLVTTEGIHSLMVFGSSTSLSVADIAERQKIPFVAMGMSDKITMGKSNVFRHFSTARSQHSLIAKEITRRGYKSIALVTLAQEAMVNMRELFLENPVAQVVVSEDILPGDTDLRGIATRIKAKNPSAVYFLVLTPHISSLARNLRDLGYQGEFFGAAPLQHKGEVEAANGALENTWFVTADDTSAIGFMDAYHARFNSDPHPDGLPACDVAQIMIELADEPNLAQALKEKKSFSGIFGNYTLGANNTFDIPVTIKVIKNGKFSLLHENSKY